MVTTEERAESLVNGVAAGLRHLPVVLVDGGRRELEGIRRDAAQVVHGDRTTEASGRARSADDRISWGWYLGLGGMAALRFVEWPVALLLGVTHAIERHSHDKMLDQLVEGVDEGI